MQFATAQKEDFPQILGLYEQFNEDRIEAGVGDAGYKTLKGEMPWAATLTDPDCITFVLREKSIILGFITLRDSKLTSLKNVRKLMEVDLMVIDKRVRKKGLGELLYGKAKDYMRSQRISHVLLNVLETNTAAMNFWQKMGCKKISKTEYERSDGHSENTFFMLDKL